MAVAASGRSELHHVYDLGRDPDCAEEIPEFIVGEYTTKEIEAVNRGRLGLPGHTWDQDGPSNVIIGEATGPR